ncbi:hypothetical protein [Blastopirellula marina]|uniref:Uncharacterized protein n=1 Tax=Blastopirellula marina TaxID=124 RepID=A0A2S8GP73_9BACT|nr:hypothetical protein [Blastopirellula marina]PQO46229.1 hypothetical protein C5Y93_09590 [Blastopirellula marina]
MIDQAPQNPFESPRAVDEELVQAQLVDEPKRRKKKDLAPTPVVLAMMAGMFLSPLVPSALLFLGPGSVLIAMLTMVLSMLLLTKTPFTRGMGQIYFGAVAFLFFAKIAFPPPDMSTGFRLATLAGLVLSAGIVILLSLPISRRFYFGPTKK